MTSEERREGRYQRRRAKREAGRPQDALRYDEVFTFLHLYRSALKCFRGVSWKASVQSYKAHCGINVARKAREMAAGGYKMRRCPEFYTRERGHVRRINSIHIADRVPQKCNSVYCLKPALHRSLIWDNYASQEGKGTTRARKRLQCMLERHIRRYGMAGGMVIFDFKGFFDSVEHGLVEQVLREKGVDERLTAYNMRIVEHSRKGRGLVLGSENSQDFAIATPDALDHLARDKLGLEGYGRYMDDGWMIHPDMGYLRGALARFREEAEGLGFALHPRKCRIIPFGKPFTMLKRKYLITKSGGIIQRPVRESLIRERRKLKRLYGRYTRGTMAASAGAESLAAWKASLTGCRAEKAKRQMDALYRDLYIRDWLTRQEANEACITKSYPTGTSWTPATG